MLMYMYDKFQTKGRKIEPKHTHVYMWFNYVDVYCRIPDGIKHGIASQQSAAVGIPVPADLIGDDPPGIPLGHITAVEADQTSCSDYNRHQGL